MIILCITNTVIIGLHSWEYNFVIMITGRNLEITGDELQSFGYNSKVII